MESMQRLRGRVAVVTGGGRGIGKAVALAYAREGADVVVVARSQDEIAGAAREIETLGRRAVAVTADVCQPDQVQTIVATTLQRLGRVDILFNAGLWRRRRICPSRIGSGSLTPTSPAASWSVRPWQGR